MFSFKQLAKLTIVTFLLLFVTDFIIHGKILRSMYMETPDLWRTEEEMQSMMMFMMIGKFLMGFFFSWIFLCGYKGKGVGEGFRYGLLMGGIFAGHALIMHAVSPYPTKLTMAWIGFGFIQLIICGITCAKLTRSAS